MARQGSAVGIYRTFGDSAALVGPVMLGVPVERQGGWTGGVPVSARGTLAAVRFWIKARRTRPTTEAAAEPAEQAAAAAAA